MHDFFKTFIAFSAGILLMTLFTNNKLKNDLASGILVYKDHYYVVKEALPVKYLLLYN